jgi:hypothetical protein
MRIGVPRKVMTCDGPPRWYAWRPVWAFVRGTDGGNGLPKGQWVWYEWVTLKWRSGFFAGEGFWEYEIDPCE